MSVPITPRDVLEFWFAPEHRPLWFRSTPEFDGDVRRRFSALWQTAASGGLVAWETTSEGALALVLVLDQFPLNMFRGAAQAFATESASRRVADRAIARGFDQNMDDEGRMFLYMPFMHSEDLADQDRSVALFEMAALNRNLEWARHHREIVRRFGRFPHRNAALGRPSTQVEIAWLGSGGAFKG